MTSELYLRGENFSYIKILLHKCTISIKILLEEFLKFRKEGIITHRQMNSVCKGSVVGSGSNSFRIETSMSVCDSFSSGHWS